MDRGDGLRCRHLLRQRDYSDLGSGGYAVLGNCVTKIAPRRQSQAWGYLLPPGREVRLLVGAAVLEKAEKLLRLVHCLEKVRSRRVLVTLLNDDTVLVNHDPNGLLVPRAAVAADSDLKSLPIKHENHLLSCAPISTDRRGQCARQACGADQTRNTCKSSLPKTPAALRSNSCAAIFPPIPNGRSTPSRSAARSKLRAEPWSICQSRKRAGWSMPALPNAPISRRYDHHQGRWAVEPQSSQDGL